MVTFGNVTIREYPMILCDNPCPKYGPALGLGWKHSDERIVDVDDRKRKNLRGMYIAPIVREAYLESAGYGPKEIKMAVKEKEWVQFQRQLSLIPSPTRVVSNEVRVWARSKKIKRAIRNLNKTSPEGGCAPRIGNIYRGWSLPVSGCAF